MLDSMSRDRVVRAGLQDLTHPRSTLNMWCIGDADIHGTHLSMMGRGMMLGVIIAKIFRARTPIDYKVSLADTVANPVETYVHCFGVFFLIVSFAKPDVIELSVCIGVGGCG